MSLTAITREVSSSINGCQLSFHRRQLIDVERGAGSVMRDSRCGSRTEPGLPDAVFVEDAAVVLRFYGGRRSEV